MPGNASEHQSPSVKITPSLICDALVFVVNLLLATPVLRLLKRGVQGFNENDQGSTLFGGIVAGSLISYSLGCWFLRGPLHRRTGFIPPDAAGCLLVAWFSLMLSLTIFATIIMMVEFGGDSESGWHMLLLFVIALLPVVFGLLAMTGGKTDQLPAWRCGLPARLAGSILVIAAILPATLIWQEWLRHIFTQNLAGSGWGMRLFACGMAMFGFAIFYWAPRLVLVWENITDRLTWITFGLAALPTIRACLFP